VNANNEASVFSGKFVLARTSTSVSFVICAIGCAVQTGGAVSFVICAIGCTVQTEGQEPRPGQAHKT